MRLLRKILAHNWLAIIFINLKMLPFKQAIKLPIDIYYGVRFESLSGSLIINSRNIKRGMIKIGGRGSEMFSRASVILDIKGKIVFGDNIEIGHGCLLRVGESGCIKFGDNVRIGALSKIFCNKLINFGSEIDFSWQCQIFDTNFHYIKNIENGDVDDMNGAINIGSYTWFGNNVTVMKNTCIPDWIIVASHSLCNKNYSDLPKYSVLGGVPVKIVAKNKMRVFENIENTDLIKFNG